MIAAFLAGGPGWPEDRRDRRPYEAVVRLPAVSAEDEEHGRDGPLPHYAAWLQQEDPPAPDEVMLDSSLEEDEPDDESPRKKAWYETIGVRGYAQFRISETAHHRDGSAPPHHAGDASIGPNSNFLIRRARIIFSGDVSDHVYIYLQPDFVVGVPGSPDANHFAQVRDWYGDIYLDDHKAHRFRVGQSKVPYGWENLQSSSNRVPFDRNDGFNSAVRNERDLGVFYYWTPPWAQEVFKFVMDEGLKGSGNYGVFGVGLYNGQGGAFQEQNENVHVVSRLTWPIVLQSGQIFELAIQGYTGKYVVLGSPIRPLGLGAEDITPEGTLQTGDRSGHLDERLGGSFIMYPQPLGFQAEWTVGRGPALSADQTAVEERGLSGGYAMLLYNLETLERGAFFPFVRWSYFQGGHKSFRNAPMSHIDEWELGCEWQFNPGAELTVSYLIADRTNLTAISSGDDVSRRSYEQFEGHVLRIQLQINY